MNHKRIITSLLVIVFAVVSALATTNLRIVTYNLLNYDGLNKTKNSYMRTMLSALDPDIVVVQEMISQTGVDSFAISALNNSLATIPFHDGWTTDNHFFYNPFEIQFLAADYLTTTLRDIAEYQIRIPSTNDTVYIYSAHLKASSGEENENQRLAEATVLRNRLNTHPEGTKFILCGDLNLYGASEPAYQKLISVEVGNSGQLFDPIDRSGEWHNNSNFEDIHTQSSRNVQLPDDGAPGGMDDRFDFILVSAAMLDQINISTYQAYGNDGNHFNESINDGTNSAVSSQIADALFYGSDHLPVTMMLEFGVSAVETENGPFTPLDFALRQNYPNPFNPKTAIGYRLSAVSDVDLSVYNVVGQKIVTLVETRQPAGRYQAEWNASEQPSGIYYAVLRTNGRFFTVKMILMK
jgi:endonuclease/exonuclease/phosphatase family metal-dependent hydrolase